MSTLTSSPSPAASPRPSLHSHVFAAPKRRSSKAAIYQPQISPSVRPYGPISSSKVPEHSPEASAGSQPAKPKYSDAGTQYTPEGFPPTAHKQLVSDQSPATNKRKQLPGSPSMSSPVDARSPRRSPPPEPQPRDAPVPLSATDATQALPSRTVKDGEGDATTMNSATAAKRARSGSGVVKIMPLQYETCNPKDLGVLIANMLMELIRLNDTIPLRDGKLTRFHSRAPPGISCHDYLLRLIQHATLSPPILLSMVYYIDRLCALYPAFTISSLTVHRFLITAATVGAKGLSDSFWTNPVYARIGGISTSELATLELEFLQRVNWRIVPKPETLVDYYVSLVQRSEGYSLETMNDEDDMNEEPP